MPKDERPKLSALDRAVQQAIGDGRVVGREDDPARDQLPNLWDWLTRTDGGRDHVMQPADIRLQLGPEGCLATVTHRDLRVSVSIACPFIGDALKALEAALASPNPPIRAWGKDDPRLRKRRPKT